jgi:outer membrane protein
VELVEPEALLKDAEAEPPQAGAAEQEALGRRPEVAEARLELSAAANQKRARYYLLFPEVNLVGAYTRLDGQVFGPPNSGFIGIRANWPIWEWGTTWYASKSAAAQADATRARLVEQERQVSLEVSTLRSQSRAAATAVWVARTAITSAEEAYRVTDALLRNGMATTTDLLAAQEALTQARLNLTRARYEQAIVRVSLHRALGE